jgi:hypothetical protein
MPIVYIDIVLYIYIYIKGSKVYISFELPFFFFFFEFFFSRIYKSNFVLLKIYKVIFVFLLALETLTNFFFLKFGRHCQLSSNLKRVCKLFLKKNYIEFFFPREEYEAVEIWA